MPKTNSGLSIMPESLKTLRENQRLTQSQLAARLGIDQGNLSRLERKNDVQLSMLRRYVDATGGQLEVVVRYPGLAPVTLQLGTQAVAPPNELHAPPTLNTLAEHIKLREGSIGRQFRGVLGFVEQFRYLSVDSKQAILNSEPEPTGEERWDVFLAAFAEFEADRHDLWRPTWARRYRPLPERWMIATVPSKNARSLISSPQPFLSRNIFLEPEDLTVV